MKDLNYFLIIHAKIYYGFNLNPMEVKMRLKFVKYAKLCKNVIA